MDLHRIGLVKFGMEERTVGLYDLTKQDKNVFAKLLWQVRRGIRLS